MPIMRAVCPECAAGMKNNSPAGFSVGQTIECPKCGTYFAVEAVPPAAKLLPAKPAPAKAVAAKPRPADDADEDRPKTKAKARRDEDEDDDDEEDDDDDRPRKKSKKGKNSRDEKGSYKKSPVRFIILGGLVVIMLVGAFFLYQKIQKEKDDANAPAPVSNPDDDLAKPFRPDPNAKPGVRK